MEAFHVGMLLTAFTVAFMALQFPSGSISDRVGRLKLVCGGLILGAVSLVTLPFLTEFPMLVVIMALYGAAFGMIFPSVSALIADHANPEERGMATGIFHSFLTAGVAIGAPVIGGIGSLMGVKLALMLSPIVSVVALIIALTSSFESRKSKIPYG